MHSNPFFLNAKNLQYAFPSHRCIYTSSSNYAKQVVQFNLSDIGEGIAEVTVKEWYVSVGQKVNQFDSICEVQSDKASVTITSKFDGVIKKLYYEVDAMAKVGLPLVDIEIQSELSGSSLVDKLDDQDASSLNESSFSSKPPLKKVDFDSDSISGQSTQNEESYNKKTLATPAVRRLATEHNVNLNNVQGSGKDGRVMKEDVLKHIEELQNASKEPLSQNEAIRQDSFVLPQTRVPLQDQKLKMNHITKAMFKTMTESLSIPHLGLSDDVDCTQLISLKPMLSKVSSETGVSITFLPFFLKAASLALSEFPLVNSVISPPDEILLKADHNIGFAMDTPSGLIVPNVKRVQDKSILDIAQEVKRMQEAGRQNSLSPADLTGGTFTLSNIGSIGGTFGIPVILPPQVAIGAIGRIQVVPRFTPEDETRIVKAHVVKVVWSADHRVIDGATITRFNNKWKGLLESPSKMLLYMK